MPNRALRKLTSSISDVDIKGVFAVVIGLPQRVRTSTPPAPDRLSSRSAPAARVRKSTPTVRESRTQELHNRHARRLFVSDALVIGFAVMVADLARYHKANEADRAMDFPWTDSPVLGYTVVSVTLLVAWMAFLGLSGTRSRRVVGQGVEEYTKVTLATLQLFGLSAIAAQLLPFEPTNIYLAIALPLGLVGLLASRMVWRRVIDHRRRRGNGVVTAVVVGNNQAATELATTFADEPEAGYHVVGLCTPLGAMPGSDSVPVGGRDIPIVGTDSAIMDAVRRTGVSTVVLAADDDISPMEVRRLIWELDSLGVELMVAPGLIDVADHRLRTRLIGGMAVLEVDTPQYHGANSAAKRVFDVLFTMVALVVALPVMIVAAIAITVSSQGPVFYRSERIGLNGERFNMWKFRTMYQGADALVADMISANGGNPLFFKAKDDPRITGVGRLLRKFSIDELPQLFNVLIDDMSIVGPRPQVQREVDSYDDLLRNRLVVKPGLTGLWQISGRSDLRVEDAVRLDLDYVENWSLLRDLMIIAKTVKTVLTADGAY